MPSNDQLLPDRPDKNFLRYNLSSNQGKIFCAVVQGLVSRPDIDINVAGKELGQLALKLTLVISESLL